MSWPAAIGEPLAWALHWLFLMRTGFSLWNGRLAPVFDVAHELLVLEDGQGEASDGIRVRLEDEPPARRALRLEEWGVGALFCGAISRPLLSLIRARGVWVQPFLAGEADEIIRAWNGKERDWRRFAMPGCCRLRRGRRSDNNPGKEGRAMPGGDGTGPWGMGPGWGWRGGPCGGRGRNGLPDDQDSLGAQIGFLKEQLSRLEERLAENPARTKKSKKKERN